MRDSVSKKFRRYFPAPQIVLGDGSFLGADRKGGDLDVSLPPRCRMRRPHNNQQNTKEDVCVDKCGWLQSLWG